MNGIQPCWARCEPSVAEMLNDPVVRAVMAADGVATDELAALLGIEVHRADRLTRREKQEQAAQC
jgi:hypothetical protein